jgi:hypothetical protein
MMSCGWKDVRNGGEVYEYDGCRREEEEDANDTSMRLCVYVCMYDMGYEYEISVV